MSYLDQIDHEKLPRHCAIIMDGNGRWAKQNGKTRIFGHTNGVKAVRDVVEACAEIGIDYLTLYAFYTENWNRPKYEINALMELLVQTIRKGTRTLNKNNIKLQAIGNLESLPGKCYRELQEAIKMTENNTALTLVLALSYSSQWEINNAVKEISKSVLAGDITPEDIDNETIAAHLTTRGIPDPELLIRTSGEFRISNFLLWQIAYAELYFTETLWPDFKRENLYKALVDYQSRERRFGKTSEQIKATK